MNDGIMMVVHWILSGIIQSFDM